MQQIDYVGRRVLPDGCEKLFRMCWFPASKSPTRQKSLSTPINHAESISYLIYIYIYICVCVYLGQWNVSLDPIKQTILTEAHIMQSTIVQNCSGEEK